jgi:myosin heavy subunit
MADTIQAPLNSFEDVGTILREIGEKQEKTALSLNKTNRRLSKHAEWQKERETRAKEHAEWRERMEKLAEKDAESMEKHTKEIEEIRAILKETDRLTRETAESMKDTDRRMKETAESMKDTDRRMKEADRRMKEAEREIAEAGRLIKENSRQMGLVQNKLGELVEHIVIPNINEKFKHFGYVFGTPQRNVKFYDKNHSLIAEADILMLGDAGFMIGEVKTTLKKEDVDRHVKRLETIRNNAAWPPIDGGRKRWGFIAGAIADEDVKEYARQKGLFVAAQSGDTIKLDVPDDFVPKTW